jgi:hypothetical protein
MLYTTLLVSTEYQSVFSHFSAANQMIYRANHPIMLYQLVVTDFICWLPVNITENFLTECLIIFDRHSVKV